MRLIEAKNNQECFKNLFSLYVYELSSHDLWLGKMIREDGRFGAPKGFDDYFNGAKEAYIILSEDKPIGFISYINNEQERVYCLEEVFITYAYRNKGIISEIWKDYVKKKNGTFTTHVLKNNKEAQRYFEKLFEKNGYSYEKSELDEIAINYEIII